MEYIPNNARIFTCRVISVEMFGLIESSPNMVLKPWNSENVKKTKHREIVEQCVCYKVHSLITYAKLSQTLSCKVINFHQMYHSARDRKDTILVSVL